MRVFFTFIFFAGEKTSKKGEKLSKKGEKLSKKGEKLSKKGEKLYSHGVFCSAKGQKHGVKGAIIGSKDGKLCVNNPICGANGAGTDCPMRDRLVLLCKRSRWKAGQRESKVARVSKTSGRGSRSIPLACCGDYTMDEVLFIARPLLFFQTRRLFFVSGEIREFCDFGV